MDVGASRHYFYCTHCQDNVSESTFRRHMHLVNNSSMLGQPETSARSSSESDISELEEAQHGMGKFIKYLCLNRSSCSYKYLLLD